MNNTNPSKIKEVPTKKAWSWIPTLYFAEGLPYIIVMSVSVIMYKRLGISNADIALYTSWLYLPWVIKPLWSPIVDLLKTKRFWITTMQLVIGGGIAGVAFTIPAPNFFQYTLAFFWLIAFSSATHDIAADGFYMLALSENQQSFFVGIRSTFYRFAMIAGQGLFVMLAGYLEVTLEKNPGDSIPFAWMFTFTAMALLFFTFFIYHKKILPKPDSDKTAKDVSAGSVLKEFFSTFLSFFKKEKIGLIIGFLLLYRLGEAQLQKLAAPFMLDGRELGGLGLTTSEVGFIYGTIGIISLVLGGILGGFAISKGGLKKWLWIMLLAINLPNLVYVYMAFIQPLDILIIYACVIIEQFGYGFGFTAYMMYMIYVANGEFKTSHYALATGFMALGMMIPGMFSGFIQEAIGYKLFFVWVCAATIPSFVIAKFIPLDPSFGKKKI